MAFNAEDFKDDAEFTKFIQDATESAVASTVADLKAKNEAVIGEKKKLQEMLTKFGDMDVEQAKKAMDFLNKNETAKLISEGKFDEVLESHTEKLKSEYQEKIDNLTTELGTVTTDRDSHKSRYEVSVVDAEIRKLAVKEGILPDAIEDVLVRGRSIFSYGEDGSVEARTPNGELLKIDDKLVTPTTWLKTLPRHYWPVSEGAGAQGGSMSDDEARLASAAKSGDHATYRKLRKAIK